MMVGKQTGGRDFVRRFVLLTALMGACLLVLIGRLYHLQISRGDEYKEKSIDNFVKETRLPADRGMVLDNRGRILVDNRPSYNVTLTPAFCQPSGAAKGYCVNDVLPKLFTYLGIDDADETARIIDQFKHSKGLERFRDFTVKVDVDLDSLDRLEANRLDLAGVDVIAAPHRSYRFGTLAAHVMGYMNEISGEEMAGFDQQGLKGYQLGDYIGRRGVERKFESDLRGTDGSLKTVVDAKGRKIPNADSDDLLSGLKRLTKPVSGHNLVLSVSLPLQQTAEKAFESAAAGSIVAVDVNTGFLLAVVSKPAYDPNKLTGRITRAELKAISEDPLEPLIFRAAQQQYHPGSTFKVFTALAGLQTGAIVNGTTAFCNGGYSLGKRRWRCHNEAGHGLVDLHHAISYSCDTFFYQTGDRMGVDPIHDIGDALGLGKVPGLDLSPEAPGVLPSTEYHNRVTPGGYTKGLALNTAIGQGDDNVSPLQLVMAYAAIGNGGTLYKPQVVRRIEDGDGHLLRTIDPVVVSRLQVPPKNLAAVVDGLKAVVGEQGGTAYWIRFSLAKELKTLTEQKIPIAGKTGTAQVIAIGEKRIKENDLEFAQRDHAWFVAFAPADQPEIAIVVLNEHGGHGGTASAPAAFKILEKYFSLKAEEAAVRNALPPPPEQPPPPPPPAKDGDDKAPAGHPREAQQRALPLPQEARWS